MRGRITDTEVWWETILLAPVLTEQARYSPVRARSTEGAE
jgi:hypothetical protein